MAEITAYIGLGSNLGDRRDFIRRALKQLGEAEKVEFIRASDIIETEPLGQENQPNYLNMVVQIKTTLTAEQLHQKLLEIESSLGRIRRQKWASRTIDLDLLFYGSDIIEHPDLTIPHPQMHLRTFVLKCLCQLNSDFIHPVLQEPVNILAERLAGEDFVLDIHRPQLVSVAGVIGVGKTTLAKALSERLGCKLLLEPYDKNPFLPAVYAGKKELALDSQLYFLTSRSSQLSCKALTPGQIVISDYIFDQDHIYAKQLLNNRQLELYGKIYEPLSTYVIEPVLVVYMWDSSKKCLERIHGRGRPYEQKIELQFLDALGCDYEYLFAGWKTCPVIRITASEFDCRRNSDIKHLANQVKFYAAGF